MIDIEQIEADLARGPQGGEYEVGVPQYQAHLGVKDAWELVAELKRLRNEVAEIDRVRGANIRLTARVAELEKGWGEWLLVEVENNKLREENKAMRRILRGGACISLPAIHRSQE